MTLSLSKCSEFVRQQQHGWGGGDALFCIHFQRYISAVFSSGNILSHLLVVVMLFCPHFYICITRSTTFCFEGKKCWNKIMITLWGSNVVWFLSWNIFVIALHGSNVTCFFLKTELWFCRKTMYFGIHLGTELWLLCRELMLFGFLLEREFWLICGEAMMLSWVDKRLCRFITVATLSSWDVLSLVPL